MQALRALTQAVGLGHRRAASTFVCTCTLRALKAPSHLAVALSVRVSVFEAAEVDLLAFADKGLEVLRDLLLLVHVGHELLQTLAKLPASNTGVLPLFVVFGTRGRSPLQFGVSRDVLFPQMRPLVLFLPQSPHTAPALGVMVGLFMTALELWMQVANTKHGVALLARRVQPWVHGTGCWDGQGRLQLSLGAQSTPKLLHALLHVGSYHLLGNINHLTDGAQAEPTREV